ncbi:MAG: WxL domain-containing protein [Turicibacter sp.]|nr:WxL domain-containing protein [Turicibacter sp.]
MKFTKITTGATLAALLLASSTIPALAFEQVTPTPPGAHVAVRTEGIIRFETSNAPVAPVDPTTPEEVVVPGTVDPETGIFTPDENATPGTAGPLSIDWASNFDFGTLTIASTFEDRHAALQVMAVNTAVATEDEPNPAPVWEVRDVPNFVQVTDSRGTLVGWNLSVRQAGQFATARNADGTLATGAFELAGAEITIDNIQHDSAFDSEGVTVRGTALVLDGTTTAPLMSAAAGYGAGTHILRFGEDEATALQSVTLSIPDFTTVVAQDYTTDLIWSLANVPSNSLN